MGQCPFLKRYNYPFNLSQLEINEWFLSLCEQYCPLKKTGHCYYDWQDEHNELKKYRVPCPKCGSKANWEIAYDYGVECLYCNNIVYWDNPLSRKPWLRV